MRILIKDVKPAAGGSQRVLFTSSAGEGIATWQGRIAPVEGMQCDVELDLLLPIEKGALRPSKEETLGLLLKGDGTLLRAKVEGVDEDNVVYLRLSPDCLVMVETAGGMSGGEVVEVLLSAEQFVVTLTGI